MDKTTTSKKVQLNFATPYHRPALAIYNGELVRVSHIGDAEGMSPVFGVIDSEGNTAWVPTSDVKIVDQEFRPLSQEDLESLRSAKLSGSSSSIGQTAGTRR